MKEVLESAMEGNVNVYKIIKVNETGASKSHYREEYFDQDELQFGQSLRLKQTSSKQGMGAMQKRWNSVHQSPAKTN